MQIEPEDCLPKLICPKCINKAHTSYKFQLQCTRSQSLLKAYIVQLNKSNTNKSLDSLSQTTSPLTSRYIKGAPKIKKEENSNKIFKEKHCTSCKFECNKITADTLEDKAENRENNKRDIQHPYSKHINNGNKNSNLERKNIQLENDFNDNNSESDILSLTGEDFLSTEDILKSLDLISNEGNHEDLDLDEDEDCDDLKSCIPLGDETVDQLIKDNLQVDNLDSLNPKLESFNFNLSGKEAADLTSIKCKIEKSSDEIIHLKLLKSECTELDHCNNKFKHNLENSLDAAANLKYTNKQPTLLNDDKIESTKFNKSLTKVEIQPISYQTTNKKSNIEFISVKTPTKSSKFGIAAFKLPIKTKFENLPSQNKTNLCKTEYVSQPLKNGVEFSNFKSPTVIQSSLNETLNEDKSKSSTVKNPSAIIKTSCDTQKVGQITLKRILNERKTSVSTNGVISYNKPFLSPDRKEQCASILFTCSDDKNNLKANNNFINDSKLKSEIFTMASVKQSTNPVVSKQLPKPKESFFFKHSPDDFKVELSSPCSTNDISDAQETTFEVITNECKIPTESVKNLNSEHDIKLASCKDLAQKAEHFFENSNEESIKDENRLKKSPQNVSNGISLIYSSNVSRIKSALLKCSKNEHSLYKSSNVQPKYSISKNSEIERPLGKFVPLNDTFKPIHPSESFQQIKTFSIKPREPPNMDYYKKIQEDNTIVSFFFNMNIYLH